MHTKNSTWVVLEAWLLNDYNMDSLKAASSAWPSSLPLILHQCNDLVHLQGALLTRSVEEQQESSFRQTSESRSSRVECEALHRQLQVIQCIDLQCTHIILNSTHTYTDPLGGATESCRGDGLTGWGEREGGTGWDRNQSYPETARQREGHFRAGVSFYYHQINHRYIIGLFPQVWSAEKSGNCRLFKGWIIGRQMLRYYFIFLCRQMKWWFHF